MATVGRMEALPGAPNVVPGGALAPLDVRHADDARDDAVAALRARAEAIAAARGVDARLARPARERRRSRWTRGSASGSQPRCARRACEPLRLASGAGHDAVALAAAMPVAMLFVRCAGGVSHHPDESVDAADVAVALDVLDRFVRGLA